MSLFVSAGERVKEKAPKRCSTTMEKGTPERLATAALSNVAKDMITPEQLAGLDESAGPAMAVEELFGLSAFCIVAGHSSTAREKSFMGCFRLSLQGAHLAS